MGKSSKDKRDYYYRLAKEQGWRARSAFKLLQLHEQFGLLDDVTRVVDLCAAPGSWSQVLSRVLFPREGGEESGGEHADGGKGGNDGVEVERETEEQGEEEDDEVVGGLASQMVKSLSIDTTVTTASTEVIEWKKEVSSPLSPSPKLLDEEKRKGEKRNECDRRREEDVKIIAMDLQPMTPLPHVTTLQADITHPTTLPLLLAHLAPHTTADLVLSDGAPDVTGLHDLDSYIQGQLLLAALNLATCVLRAGGTFVAKIFRGPDSEVLFAQLACLFERVSCAKPRSSRGSSVEAFVVCEGYRPPMGFRPSLERPLGLDMLETLEQDGERKGLKEDVYYVVPFVACGDLSSWDSDATYQLPEEMGEMGNVVKWESKEPVQPPTAPPYKTALEVRRRLGNGGKV